MTMLTHRCIDCGHPDFFHGDGIAGCSQSGCPCRGERFNAEPEQIPTFDPYGRAEVTLPLAPGQRMAQGLRQCDCERCTELLAGVVEFMPRPALCVEPAWQEAERIARRERVG